MLVVKCFLLDWLWIGLVKGWKVLLWIDLISLFVFFCIGVGSIFWFSGRIIVFLVRLF